MEGRREIRVPAVRLTLHCSPPVSKYRGFGASSQIRRAAGQQARRYIKLWLLGDPLGRAVRWRHRTKGSSSGCRGAPCRCSVRRIRQAHAQDLPVLWVARPTRSLIPAQVQISRPVICKKGKAVRRGAKGCQKANLFSSPIAIDPTKYQTAPSSPISYTAPAPAP